MRKVPAAILGKVRLGTAPDPWGQRAPAPQGSVCHLSKQWEQEGRRQTETQGNERISLTQRGRPSSRGSSGAAVDGEDAAEGGNVWISLSVFGVNPRALWSQKIIDVKED